MKEFIEKLISRLEESQERYDDVAFAEMNENGQTLDFEYAHGKKDGVSETIEIVNQLAEEFATDTNVVSKNGWIPCSERLPDEATVYEVTEEIIINSKKQYIVEHRLFGTEGEWLHPSHTKVIAWMPLPAPYKEGEIENE